MKKKIIFFDGDGTLWYPKETKRTMKPWWVYEMYPHDFEYLNYLMLDPDVLPLLQLLKQKNIRVIILSTHPDSLPEADLVLKKKVEHLGLAGLIDEYYVTVEKHEAKAEKIIELLEKYNLDKTDALMVGDSYNWDYAPTVAKGIDAVLIDSAAIPLEKRATLNIIYNLSDLTHKSADQQSIN